MLQFFSPDILNRLQSYYGTADWTKWNLWRRPQYDWIRYPGAGATTLPFFSVPLGGTDPTSLLAKTLEQTNLFKSRSFGEQLFILTEIRTHIHVLPKQRQPVGINNDANVTTSTFSGLMTILSQLAGQGVLHLSFGQKLFYSVPQPFKFAPPGFGVEIDQHASSAAGAWWFQQNISPERTYGIQPMQWVEANQTIELNIDFPNGTSPSIASSVNETTPSVNIGVIFDGYLVAPMQ